MTATDPIPIRAAITFCGRTVPESDSGVEVGSVVAVGFVCGVDVGVEIDVVDDEVGAEVWLIVVSDVGAADVAVLGEMLNLGALSKGNHEKRTRKKAKWTGREVLITAIDGLA